MCTLFANLYILLTWVPMHAYCLPRGPHIYFIFTWSDVVGWDAYHSNTVTTSCHLSSNTPLEIDTTLKPFLLSFQFSKHRQPKTATNIYSRICYIFHIQKMLNMVRPPSHILTFPQYLTIIILYMVCRVPCLLTLPNTLNLFPRHIFMPLIIIPQSLPHRQSAFICST